MSDATSVSSARDRRWLILGVIGLAQLMVVLDVTVMNIALPSAQGALGFTTVERQWVVTAYTLAFGSLLLPGGRLADLFGRKVTFLAGLAGFAGVSAIGGASVNFAMLVTARACQGAFAALLVPSALSLLTTTFTEPKDRSKAFGIYGAIAGAGGAVGLLLGGGLTEYLSWRWTLYVNLIFAGVAFTGGALLLQRQPSRVKPRLDVPGVVLVSGAVFCLVYGFSNAAAHHWATPSTYGFLAAGVALSVAFALWHGSTTGGLGPAILAGIGLGMVIGAGINTGTFGVAPQGAGVAAATVTVGQMLGGSVGTSLLNTIFTSAVASYITAHLATARIIGRQALTGLALAHGYDTAFWWTAGIFAGGAIVSGVLLRRGPLVPTGTPSRARAEMPTAQAKAGPALLTAPRANRLIDLRGFLIHCPVLASARSWVICAATIMVDGCTGVRSASIWRTQSQALPRCPSVASMVDE